MTRIKRDLIAYLVIVGFCIVMLSWAIPVYTPAYPGYGASPSLVQTVAVYVILMMALISVISIGLANYLNKPLNPAETEFPQETDEDVGFTQVGRVNGYHLFRMMIPSMMFVVLIEYIGYELAAILLLLVIQYVIGCRKPIQAILMSILLTGVIYIVMRYGFGVPIPGAQIFE